LVPRQYGKLQGSDDLFRHITADDRHRQGAAERTRSSVAEFRLGMGGRIGA
jgi:hypothetical protein